jgi:hypothetical protein
MVMLDVSCFGDVERPAFALDKCKAEWTSSLSRPLLALTMASHPTIHAHSTGRSRVIQRQIKACSVSHCFVIGSADLSTCERQFREGGRISDPMVEPDAKCAA